MAENNNNKHQIKRDYMEKKIKEGKDKVKEIRKEGGQGKSKCRE